MTDVERAWRSERARLVAGIARRFGDLDLAEDAAQDAFASAATAWRSSGVPAKPGAWLWRVALRRAIDMLRRTSNKEVLGIDGLADFTADESGAEPHGFDDGLRINDDVLGLILACAHPAIAPDGRIALTLRHVAGFLPREIAAAFLVTEAAMEKRLVRARAKLRAAGVSLGVPSAQRLQERLDDARGVVWLIFTEGHLASGEGPPIRLALCLEALRLARALRDLAPHDPENTGLLAALLFHHARVDARLDAHGELVAFDRQDRSRWNHRMIAEARMLLAETALFAPGPYCVGAAIAALHAASQTNDVAWARVAELYALLRRMTPSDVVDLNYGYAVGRSRRSARTSRRFWRRVRVVGAGRRVRAAGPAPGGLSQPSRPGRRRRAWRPARR